MVDNKGHCQSLSVGQKPKVFAFWHENLLPGFHLLRTLQPVALVSPSRDGQRLSAILERWGYSVIRGSSTRQGPSAALECIMALQRGKNVVITPDGPRGPRRNAKHGVVKIARAAGVAVIPLAFHCRPSVRLLSWDRFVVPLPLARIRVMCSPPLELGPDCDPHGNDSVRILADIERGMNG